MESPLQSYVAFTEVGHKKTVMITYVTAFLCNKNPKRGYDEYKGWFDKLAATGLPFILFLDRQLSHWTFPETVRVYPVSIEDTWVYKYVSGDAILPYSSNPNDTFEYMRIQNTKLEWLVRAIEINPYQTNWFAWIDFGIVHVFSKPEETLQRLQSLTPPSTPGIRTAGIWSSKTRDVWNAICYRFAGGFILGDTESLYTLYGRFQDIVLRERPKFAWEINIWALLESEGTEFGWFAANHNDSIIP
jgi:hypothetical protein